MPEPALDCATCAELGEWSGDRLVRPFVPPVNLGHDSDAHRIYKVLAWNRVGTAEDLASRTDPELLKMRGFGVGMLRRIRTLVPAQAASATLDVAVPARDANEALDRLNRGLAKLGMPTTVLTVTTGRDLSGWPEAVIRLAHADDPECGYGEIRIPLRIKDGEDA